jgi:D-sedoheptulose 7-phosphate isomerase
VLIGISTSGSSPDVVAAVETARARGLVTIGLTGRDGGMLGHAVDIHLNVPSPSTARTQEVHCTLLHVLCELVEQELVDIDG